MGVARALGGDPDVLLMDEPFGAIDPITRDRLQNEFLRLQGELKKTIVFVTHDIDEAIKMGDRIAILGEQSVIRQFDTPERILAYPVDDFVSDFIGSGSTLKGLNFERVRDLQLSEDWPIVSVDTDRADAQRLYDASPEKWMLVLDAEQRPIRWVNDHHLADTATPLVAGRRRGDGDRRAQCHAARRPRRDAAVERRPGRRRRRQGPLPGHPRHRTCSPTCSSACAARPRSTTSSWRFRKPSSTPSNGSNGSGAGH